MSAGEHATCVGIVTVGSRCVVPSASARTERWAKTLPSGLSIGDERICSRVTLVVHFEAHSSKRTRHDAGVVRSPGRHVRAEVRTRGRALHRSRSATTRTKSRAPPAPTRRRSKLVTNTRPDAPPLFRRRCSSDRPPRESRRARMESRRAVVRGSVSQVASGSGGDETCHAPDTGTSASRENLSIGHIEDRFTAKTTVRLCLSAREETFSFSRTSAPRYARATPRDAARRRRILLDTFSETRTHL